MLHVKRLAPRRFVNIARKYGVHDAELAGEFEACTSRSSSSRPVADSAAGRAAVVECAMARPLYRLPGRSKVERLARGGQSRGLARISTRARAKGLERKSNRIASHRPRSSTSLHLPRLPPHPTTAARPRSFHRPSTPPPTAAPPPFPTVATICCVLATTTTTTTTTTEAWPSEAARRATRIP